MRFDQFNYNYDNILKRLVKLYYHIQKARTHLFFITVETGRTDNDRTGILY